MRLEGDLGMAGRIVIRRAWSFPRIRSLIEGLQRRIETLEAGGRAEQENAALRAENAD